MNKYKFLKISPSKKIRYLINKYKKKTYVVFLHGFMSDLEGEKPKKILKFCNSKRIGFLAIEYSGHGKSTGKFTKGNISKWTNEVRISIKKIVKKNKFILVGSSMGSWISLNQFKFFNNQILGFLGIGSAPEFLENLMWKKFNKKIKNEIKKNKIPFKCILVGFGIEKKNKILNNLIQKFNLKNELILLGQQNKINVIMNEIDVNILASGYGEAFPNVVAEAMASGTPCVVTDVGDSSLIVGDTGWVTRTSNSKELANNIKKAINKSKSKKWNYLCLKARKRIVKKFSIKKMIVSYNKIWQQTL